MAGRFHGWCSMLVAQAETVASGTHCGVLPILLAIFVTGDTHRLSHGEALI